MKTYKGFNRDMTCRNFQYKEGETYETEDVVCCETGFHGCEYPLDCFEYYNPAESVFHEVEQSGKIDREEGDSKISSTKIKIGARLSITGLVQAAIDFTMARIKPRGKAVAKSDEYYSAASSTGSSSAASSTGNCSAASSTSEYSIASSTGRRSAASSTGYHSLASSTGACSAASSTGACSAASSGHETSIAVAWGYHGKAKGVLGSYIVLADWRSKSGESRYWDAFDWEFKGAKMIKIDGKKYKPNTWYSFDKGKIVEVEENV